jgi:hypothetical protein
MRRARPSRHKTNPRTPSQLSVYLGHVGRSRFMPADNQTNGLLAIIQSIQDREVTFPRHAENQIDALDSQSFYQHLRTGAELRVSHDFGSWFGALHPVLVLLSNQDNDHVEGEGNSCSIFLENQR